jgi:dienelactone hydrolase
MHRRLTWLLLLCLIGTASAQDLVAALREEVVTVKKSGLFTLELETTYFRPPGDGPFPLVIINHGKAPGDTRFQGRARYLAASRELVQRGYAVVVPMRQGFSKSSGSYIGGGCNVYSNGLAQAEDVRATLEAYAQRPEVDARRVVVLGQSHGGLTTLATGALNLPGVVGLVNFAGGLRQEQCVGWERNLADAFGRYGKATQVPALFFYGDNDSYWSVPTWTEMVREYNEGSGGKARVVAFGVFGRDAHEMFASRSGVKVWLPEMDKFFRQLGLPFDKQRDIALVEHAEPVPADSGFAPLADAQALPGASPAAREGYNAFLAAEAPKAFALGAHGGWSWRSGVAGAMSQALERCGQRNKDQPCKLYAVDDRVVWTKDGP